MGPTRDLGCGQPLEKSMKIIYDISVLGLGRRYPPTGIHRTVDEVLQQMLLSPDCQLSLSCLMHWGIRDCQAYLGEHAELAGLPTVWSQSRLSSWRRIWADWCAGRLTGHQRGLGRYFWIRLRDALRPYSDNHPALGEADIFHNPGLYPMQPRVGRARRFLTLYDLIPILYPQHCSQETVALYNQTLRSLEPEDYVLAISECSKQDLLRFRPELHPDHITVTPLAASDRFSALPAPDDSARRRALGLPEGPYMLCINTMEPRKNLSHVIESFVHLLSQQNLPDLHLVIAGAKGWGIDRPLVDGDVPAEIRRRIHIAGFVPDHDLPALYRGALGFLFMSHYEGFGLPVLEAMRSGLPVICSNNSSLPEVAGEAALMLDSRDRDGLCQKMLDLYQSADLRARLSALSLTQAERFHWKHTADLTLAAYRQALR